MFNFLFGLFSNDMGIDLGTATVLVHVKDRGIILSEPSVVALDKESVGMLDQFLSLRKWLIGIPTVVAIYWSFQKWEPHKNRM